MNAQRAVISLDLKIDRIIRCVCSHCNGSQHRREQAYAHGVRQMADMGLQPVAYERAVRRLAEALRL